MLPANQVGAIKSGRAGAARGLASGPTEARVFVSRRAGTHPGCEFVCNFTMVGPPTAVAEAACDVFPSFAMPRVMPSEGMSDLVKECLLHLVVAAFHCKVP